jgi:hypothetical protein
MGGSIVLSESNSVTLARNPFMDNWRVLDRDRNELLRLERCRPTGAGRFAAPIDISLEISSKANDDVGTTVTTLIAVYVVFTEPSTWPTGQTS